MAIIFTKNMSVGNDAIDHDHHFMMNFVNTIELILQKKEERKYLLTVLFQLYKYSLNHFSLEESIQRKIEYPQSLKHKSSHSKLLSELKSLIKGIEERGAEEEIQSSSDEITKFLRNWLINHVLNEDLLLKPHLEKHPRGFF